MNLEKLANMLIEMNKTILSNKEHIKKYKKIRNLHSGILDSMDDYMFTGKYDINEHFSSIHCDLNKEISNVSFALDSNYDDDLTIFEELFIYKNPPKVESLTEIYLKNNKFRNKIK